MTENRFCVTELTVRLTPSSVTDPLVESLPEGLVEMMRYEGLMDEHVFLMMPYHLEVH